MTETDEITTLLRRYAADGSDDAFLSLMQRYMDLVYGAALRRLNGDEGLAQDVVQRVFMELARDARKLRTGAGLGGWLYRRAVHMAADLHKAECRRTARERAALLPEPPQAAGTPDEWSEAQPLLEDAISRLPAADREAVVLRFMENRPLRSVGESLGISEDAAQKRITRALEKLRRLMGRRGSVTGTAALALGLSRHSAQATPAGVLREVFALCQPHTAAVKHNFAALLFHAIAMKPVTIAVIALAAAAGVAVPFITADVPAQKDGNAGPLSAVRPEIARPAAPARAAGPLVAGARAIPLLPGLTADERATTLKSTRAKAEKATLERYEEKMERLRRKLNLTDAQAEAIAAHHRAQRERMIEYITAASVGEAEPQHFYLENYRTDVPAPLHEMLSAEQKALLAEHEATRRTNFLEAATNGELSSLALKLELNEAAKDALFERLTAINREDRFADASGIKDLSALAAQADRDIAHRRAAFAEVLTPEQMKSWETNAAGWRSELLKTFGHREGEALATAGETPDGGS